MYCSILTVVRILEKYSETAGLEDASWTHIAYAFRRLLSLGI
jgi:hypothetical protein